MNHRILIIDDDPNLLHLYQDFLSPDLPPGRPRATQNFDVTTARHGQEGYEIVKQQMAQNQPFAVAFIDMRMRPGWDGLRTAREIRAADDRIFIVIVTGYHDHSIDLINDVLGHDVFYLSKPSCRDEIYQMARSLCHRWNCAFGSETPGAAADSPPKTDNCQEHLSETLIITGATELTRALLNNSDLIISNFPFKIGRSNAPRQGKIHPNNGLLLEDSEPYTVSRNHLMINAYKNEYYVLDTGSRLGTIVNGETIGHKTSRYKANLHAGKNSLVVGSETSPFVFTITLAAAPETDASE